VHALSLVADAASASGRRDDAAAAYHRALALAEDLGMRPMVARCRMGLGALEEGAGEPERGQELQATALRMYREMGMGD
jgi:hypothetical protein